MKRVTRVNSTVEGTILDISHANVVTSMDRNGVVVTNGYDVLRRLTVRQAFGYWGQTVSGLESFAYTSRGLTNYTDPLGESTVYARDAAGQLLYQTNANLEVLRFTYTPDGQLSSLTDGKNQTTRWNYNLYGLTTNKVDAANTEIFRYAYDAGGRLTNRWTAAKGDTGYRYDLAGNLTNIAYPAWTNVFQYDGLNRLVGMRDRVGDTSFAWTDGDQLAAEDGPWASDTVSYGYSHRVRSGLSLAQPNASAWVQGYGYDDYGRLTSVVSPAGTFGYEYAVVYATYGAPAADLVAQLNLPSGAFVRNTHDELGRLTARELDLPDWTPIDQLGYGYNEGSQRTQQVFTAGNYVNYTYDPIGQLKSARGYESGGAARLHEQFGYGYDAAWNLAYRTNNALVRNFGVDNLNELTGAGRSGTLTVAGTATERKAPSEWESGVTNVTVSGTGLASGNAELYADGSWARAGATPAGSGSSSYTATARDTYGRESTDSVSVSIPSTNSFTYDANGNLTGDGVRTFEYDFENQLTNVYVSGQWRSQFVYDGLMRRRTRREYTWSGGVWVQTNEVRYVYDRRLVLQERDANNIGKVVYTRGRDLSGSLEEAGGIGGLLARTDQSTLNPQLSTAFYHSDANGNVVCLINSSNALVARYEYDPYGNIVSQSGPLAEANLYRFSSKEAHPNSGLVYYLYRYYEPGLQRWVNRDPIEEDGGLNMYGFVRNRPSGKVDPFGESDENRPPVCVTSDLGTGMMGEALYGPPAREPQNRRYGGYPGFLPASAGVSLGAQGTAGFAWGQVHGQVSGGAGLFIPEGVGRYTSYGGSTGPLGLVSPQNPGRTRAEFNPEFGMFAGAGGGLWLSNARNAASLQRTITTWSLNVGAGLELSVSISYGDGIWLLEVQPPPTSIGWGFDFGCQRTTTTGYHWWP